MLSKENNDLLTRVGPGTPMGNLLRRFWFPALLAEEVSQPDGDPVRLRLLGEDLVAFRDSNGELGILDAYCPHRTVHLYFGRNEQCGIRCVYHGWKFDVRGNCVDMPSEPEGDRVKHKIKAKSYPTHIAGGAVWIYMGPTEQQPEPPAFERMRLSEPHLYQTKRWQRCNWAQAVEGGIDSSHISYLHSNNFTAGLEDSPARLAMMNPNVLGDRAPKFEVEETDYGLRIAARRSAPEDCSYWRITQFLLPFYQLIPPSIPDNDSRAAAYSGHAWVPIDDENTWTWSWGVNPHREYSEDERKRSGGRDGSWGPVDEAYHPLLNKDNDYLLDRAKQRTGHFTGIEGFQNQDNAVQESMGPIADRTREHLGRSDTGIIAFRRRMMSLARDLADGKEPAAAYNGAWYNVRSASVLLKNDIAWQDGARELMQGMRLEEAAE